MREQVIKAVCVTVEATDVGCIDTEAMGTPALFDYARTRDYKLLKFKPGKPPIVFHLTEVPHEYWSTYVAAADSDTDRAERAFRCSVVRVDNLPQNDGVSLTAWTPPNVSGKVRIMDEKDAALFSPAERLEIGGVAYTHSFLPRRIDGCFRLHALSVEALAHATLPLVGVSRIDVVATSSDKPSPESAFSPSTAVTVSDNVTVDVTSG